MKVISGSANKDLAEKVAKELGISLSPVEIFIFPDGERRIQIKESVLDQDVLIVQPASPPVDTNYFELFFLADAAQRSGARTISAVIPYLGYQRQDHIFRDGEAVSLDVVVKTLQSVGINKVIAFDLHTIKIVEEFSIPMSHLSALPIFADYIESHNWAGLDTVLVSPDKGGIRRIKLISQMLSDMPYAVIEKNRDVNTGHIEMAGITGEVTHRALIVDDMISSGKTIVKAAELLSQNGAEEIYVFATHAIFSDEAPQILEDSSVTKVYVSDTVLVPESKKFPKLEILSIAPHIAKEVSIGVV
ncbi:MAG: ribose-phosphate pyrophosphokinase [Candidatus Levybacteria bacterium]|nr:ribose-phosphate pyrophosphokinase [Candidatus Levybacteria bacterium]